MEILIEVGGFGMDGGTELTMIKAHINVHKSNMGRGGGGVPCEVDRIATVKPF